RVDAAFDAARKALTASTRSLRIADLLRSAGSIPSSHKHHRFSLCSNSRAPTYGCKYFAATGCAAPWAYSFSSSMRCLPSVAFAPYSVFFQQGAERCGSFCDQDVRTIDQVGVDVLPSSHFGGFTSDVFVFEESWAEGSVSGEADNNAVD